MYFGDGTFLIDLNQRARVGKFVDEQGFLADGKKKKIVNANMRNILTKRALKSELKDEFIAFDSKGCQIKGWYNIEGHFMVDEEDRTAGRNDKQGWLVDRKKFKVVNEGMA